MTSPEERLKELFTPLGGRAAPEAPTGGSPEDRMAQMFTPLPGYSAYSAASSDAGFVEPETASFAPEEKPKEDKGFFGTAWDWTKGAASGVASGFAGLGGDVRQLTELGVEKGVGLFSEKGAKKVRELSQSLEEQISDKPWLTSFFGAAAGPTSAEAEEGIKELTGYEPGTTGARIAQKAGEFVGGGLVFPGGTTAKGITSMAAAGAAGEAAKELGGGVGTQLGASLLGGVLGHRVPGAVSGVGRTAGRVLTGEAGQVFKELPAATYQKIPKIKVTPNQVKTEVVELAKKYNMDLPAGVLTDNPTLRFLEARVNESALAGKAPQEAFKRISESFIQNLENATRVAEESIPMLRNEASTYLSGALEEAVSSAKGQAGELYQAADKLLPGNSAIENLTKTRSAAEGIISKYRGIEEELLTSGGKEAFKKAQGVMKSLEKGPVTVDSLRNTKTLLGQAIESVGEPTAKAELSKLYNSINETLSEFGQATSPEWKEAFNKANKYYSEYKTAFNPKQNKIASALRSNDAEALFRQTNSVEGLKDLREVLKYHPEGEAVYKKFAEAKLEDLFRKNLIDATTGGAKFQKITSAIKDPAKQEIYKQLLGPEKYKSVQELGKLSGAINEGFRKFMNPSRTGATIADLGWGGLIVSSTLEGIATLNPAALAKVGVEVAAPRVLANMLYDKTFTETLIKMAQVSKGAPTLAKQRLYKALAISLINQADQITKASGSQIKEPGAEEVF